MRWLRSESGEYLHLQWERVAYVVVQGNFSAVTPRYADGSHVFVLDDGHDHEFVRAVQSGMSAEPDRWLPVREYVTGSSSELLPNTIIYVSKPHIVRMFDAEGPNGRPGAIAGMEVDVATNDGGPPLGIAVGENARHLRQWARATWPES